MNELILQYIASKGKRDIVVKAMIAHPTEALSAIVEFQGPYPEDIHPIDVFEEYLTPLLSELFRRSPALLIGPAEAMLPKNKYMIIAAAIAADDSRFGGLILSGLKDRSIYVKLLVVDGIARRSYLRTPEVKRELQRMLSLKSIAADPYSRQKTRAALGAFKAR